MTLLLLFNQPAAPGGSATGTAFASFVEAGMFLGQWEINDNLTFTACIHDSTGAAADADAAPSYAVYEDEGAVALVTGNMAKLGSVTGFYTESVALSAANGFVEGKCYAIRVQATVGGVVAATAHVFQLGAMVKISSATDKNTLDSVITAIQGADGDTLKDLSDEIALVGGGGAGAGTGTYTDTVTDGANPLDGVRVQLSTDSAKANPVYQAYTNALGVFLMHPDPGAYYVWFEKAGYDFSAVNGTGVTVT